jgi:maltooligosyltrehalose trehalohydrolase
MARAPGGFWEYGSGELAADVHRADDGNGDGAREAAPLPAGTDYRFVVDGGEPLPDPRSRWQPAGVHGPSRVLDTRTFAWTDAGFQAPPLSAAVIYELHVGTFTPEGTFEAAVARLDHLVDLGVTHVELMPVAAFPGDRGWGYDGVDLYAPHSAYGGPEGLWRFVNACHGGGLAVLLDVVYNHLGPDGNHLGQLGPYFTRRYATPWGEAVNLDGAGSDEVRRFFVDNALMWLRDYHIDGLRVDAVHAIVDASAVHFLEQLTTEVRELEARIGRHLTIIAESDLNDPRVIRSPAVGGYGFDAQWSEDLHHALHALLTGERQGYYADFGTLADVAKALEAGFVYDGRHSEFRGRRHGRPALGLAPDRFVGFAQNHDQIGNRARGERLCHLASGGRAKIAAAVVLTGPHVPMLFMGEEWGASAPFLYFTDHRDRELARQVRDGRRREFAAFGWDPEDVPDPQAPETFTRSKLDWSEPGRAPHREILRWHRALIGLRRSRGELRASRSFERAHARYDDAAGWLVIERGSLAVICNVATKPQRVPLGGEPRALLLASDPSIELGHAAHMPPESVAIAELADASSHRTVHAREHG